MNITLIGMPGAGKSFVGEKLANALTLTFISPDKLLEAIHGMPLQGVLEKLGSKNFSIAEADVAISHTAGKDNLLISPGGSMIYQPRAMEHLKTISRIVYLEVPFQVIVKRVGDVPRGIVFNGKTFRELYDERAPHYEKWAHVTVNGDQKPENVISDIVEVLGVNARVYA